MISPSERALVVAAHPDDEVLGCGGTIARLRDAEASVRVIFLAEGVTARYRPEELDQPHVRAALQHRNEDAIKALRLLGVPAQEIFVEQRYCCRLDQVHQIDLVKQIEGHIRDFRPTRIFTHAAHDTNVDHTMVHNAVLPAVRPLEGTALRGVYSFEVLSSTEWNPLHPFNARVFVDVTATIDRKIAAMAAYGDEMRSAPHPRSEDVLRSLARYRGAQAGVLYAEAFDPIRIVEP